MSLSLIPQTATSNKLYTRTSTSSMSAMKTSSSVVVCVLMGALASLCTTHGFHLEQPPTNIGGRHTLAFGNNKMARPKQQKLVVASPFSSTMLRMQSDFGSAMPEKPTLTVAEDLQQKSENFVLDIRGKLADGVAEPPEIAALEEACRSDNVQEISKRLYELLIEVGMSYDKDPTMGNMTPTNFTDIPGNLEEPAVKSEFSYLYRYGMGLIANELLDVDDVKAIVHERLIQRTGLSPEEFDQWLGF